jgi:excinuclease ABC subunit A
MKNRRTFLKLSALSTAAIAIKPLQSLGTTSFIYNTKTNKPIVLSTWRFGLEANAAAWEILSKNGRALDAVEAGVKIPEGDPNERSVGYGGRPDRDGKVTLEMQFLADITVECDECHGKRFKQEVLDIHHRGKSISDVLEMTIDEAVEFFAEEKSLMTRLKPLQDVGLGYVQLGQSSSTLSGGEAQRIKLAYYLIKGNGAENMLFIFDEPTTGLHFHDIQKLMKSIQALIDLGNSVIIIEHNVDVIRCADWLIDLGAEGGDTGGNLVYQGVPAGIKSCAESYTGKYL